jgi:hypothetical protein
VNGNKKKARSGPSNNIGNIPPNFSADLFYITITASYEKAKTARILLAANNLPGEQMT